MKRNTLRPPDGTRAQRLADRTFLPEFIVSQLSAFVPAMHTMLARALA